MTLANPPQFSISCEFSLCVGVFLDRPWDRVLDVVRRSGALLTLRMSSSFSLSFTVSLAIMALPLKAPLSIRWLLLLGCSDPPDELSMALAADGVKPVEEIPDMFPNNNETNT